MLPIVNKAEKIAKGWGEELIVHNSADYCGKILQFNKGGKGSMHFHLNKQESWYIFRGEFVFRTFDTETAEMIETKLVEGDIVTIHRGQPHQLEAIEDSAIFEVSTQHFDDDSYRVGKGDSQNNGREEISI